MILFIYLFIYAFVGIFQSPYILACYMFAMQCSSPSSLWQAFLIQWSFLFIFSPKRNFKILIPYENILLFNYEWLQWKTWNIPSPCNKEKFFHWVLNPTTGMLTTVTVETAQQVWMSPSLDLWNRKYWYTFWDSTFVELLNCRMWANIHIPFLPWGRVTLKSFVFRERND